MSKGEVFVVYGSVTFCTVLAVVLTILKLTNQIDTSWWIVLSPIWIPIVGSALVIALASLIMRER